MFVQQSGAKNGHVRLRKKIYAAYSASKHAFPGSTRKFSATCLIEGLSTVGAHVATIMSDIKTKIPQELASQSTAQFTNNLSEEITACLSEEKEWENRKLNIYEFNHPEITGSHEHTYQ